MFNNNRYLAYFYINYIVLIKMSLTTDIKNKISVLDLVSEHADLKRQGRLYKALCPFHNENTPSFIVSLHSTGVEFSIHHVIGSTGSEISASGSFFTNFHL